MTTILKEAADRHCEGRIVSLLEGRIRPQSARLRRRGALEVAPGVRGVTAGAPGPVSGSASSPGLLGWASVLSPGRECRGRSCPATPRSPYGDDEGAAFPPNAAETISTSK